MFRPSCLCMSFALFLFPQLSFADSVMNKCTDGSQITYTDKPCEKLGLKDAGAINKDAVTIVPAIIYSQVPQNKTSHNTLNTVKEEAPQSSDVYQCTTANGLVTYNSAPCPQTSILPQGYYAPVQQEVLSQSAACEKIGANHDAGNNSNLSCPQK